MFDREIKKYLKLERKYWVDIFDNKPYRYRLVESDSNFESEIIKLLNK